MTKVTFGLTKDNIATIEQMTEKFEGDKYSYPLWISIGKAISWDSLTACLHYFKYLEYKKDMQVFDEKLGKAHYENAEVIIMPKKPIIYTIGTKSICDEFFNYNEPFKKGRSEECEGKNCFETIKEAQIFISTLEEGHLYDIYGLDCGLDNTYILDGKRCLKEDTKLIKL